MSSAPLVFRVVDPDQADVSALLDLHVRAARTAEYGKFAFALDHSQLKAAGITLYGAYDGSKLQVIGALKDLGNDELEVKSMRVSPDAAGRGYGRAMLDHLVAQARSSGARLLRLETGTTAQYDPANRLYATAGFVPTGAFGDYRPSDFNRFYALEL